MSTFERRAAASLSFPVIFPAISPVISSQLNRLKLGLLLLLALTCSAHAIIIRGTVTDPLGAAVVGARVQLIHRGRVAAVAISGSDGTFEIRSTSPGRFKRLTSARSVTPGISDDFYGCTTAVVTPNGTLSVAPVKPAV